MDMEPAKLAEDEVFLVGDDWFQSSQHFLKKEEIQGEVIGYYKKIIEGENQKSSFVFSWLLLQMIMDKPISQHPIKLLCLLNRPSVLRTGD